MIMKETLLILVALFFGLSIRSVKTEIARISERTTSLTSDHDYPHFIIADHENNITGVD